LYLATVAIPNPTSEILRDTRSLAFRIY